MHIHTYRCGWTQSRRTVWPKRPFFLTYTSLFFFTYRCGWTQSLCTVWPKRRTRRARQLQTSPSRSSPLKSRFMSYPSKRYIAYMAYVAYIKVHELSKQKVYIHVCMYYMRMYNQCMDVWMCVRVYTHTHTQTHTHTHTHTHTLYTGAEG